MGEVGCCVAGIHPDWHLHFKDASIRCRNGVEAGLVKIKVLHPSAEPGGAGTQAEAAQPGGMGGSPIEAEIKEPPSYSSPAAAGQWLRRRSSASLASQQQAGSASLRRHDGGSGALSTAGAMRLPPSAGASNALARAASARVHELLVDDPNKRQVEAEAMAQLIDDEVAKWESKKVLRELVCPL